MDQIARALDELQVLVVEILREQDVTLEEIAECYDPPKSRQALSSWLTTRRRRKHGSNESGEAGIETS